MHHPPLLEELKAEARARGLWNLVHPHEQWGPGLTNAEYAPLAEIMGRSPLLAPDACNCSAPDTGNMEVLTMFGTDEHQERWLRPLLDGEIRSAFAMTEPAVASSDATNIETRIERDGDDYVINGRKGHAQVRRPPANDQRPDGPRHRLPPLAAIRLPRFHGGSPSEALAGLRQGHPPGVARMRLALGREQRRRPTGLQRAHVVAVRRGAIRGSMLSGSGLI